MAVIYVSSHSISFESISLLFILSLDRHQLQTKQTTAHQYNQKRQKRAEHKDQLNKSKSEKVSYLLYLLLFLLSPIPSFHYYTATMQASRH